MEQDAHIGASASADQLCYLSAGHVEGPGGTLADLELCNEDDETVGAVDGVLIDAPARRVRYFVVTSSARPLSDKFLVPADAIVRVDPDAHTALVESGDLSQVPFDPDRTRPFSDDDALTAMFGPH